MAWLLMLTDALYTEIYDEIKLRSFNYLVTQLCSSGINHEDFKSVTHELKGRD